MHFFTASFLLLLVWHLLLLAMHLLLLVRHLLLLVRHLLLLVRHLLLLVRHLLLLVRHLLLLVRHLLLLRIPLWIGRPLFWFIPCRMRVLSFYGIRSWSLLVMRENLISSCFSLKAARDLEKSNETLDKERVLRKTTKCDKSSLASCVLRTGDWQIGKVRQIEVRHEVMCCMWDECY